eukprot:1529501-Pyramimonas_sp.AAC.2
MVAGVDLDAEYRTFIPYPPLPRRLYPFNGERADHRSAPCRGSSWTRQPSLPWCPPSTPASRSCADARWSR